jgi:hypothetical protein
MMVNYSLPLGWTPWNINYASHRNNILYNIQLAMSFSNLQEYIDHIQEIVSWMGWTPWKITYASQYFAKLHAYAIQLIKAGKAFVCHQVGYLHLRARQRVRRGQGAAIPMARAKHGCKGRRCKNMPQIKQCMDSLTKPCLINKFPFAYAVACFTEQGRD